MVMTLYCSFRDIDSFVASFVSWSAISFPAILAWPGIQDRVVRIQYLINVPIFSLMSENNNKFGKSGSRIFSASFNLAHTCQNIQYVECGQYTEEEEEELHESTNAGNGYKIFHLFKFMN